MLEVITYPNSILRQISKPVESYYPLIKCSIREKEKSFLSAYNSRTKGAYKTGAKVKLFYDEEAGCIVEKKASPMLIVMTVLFWLTALVGLISIIGG